MFDDLRQFIAKTSELGNCKVIEGADWNVEIGLITELQLSRPNLLIKRYKRFVPEHNNK